MSDFPGIVPDAASRFLDSRLVCLRNASIPEKQGRWYVKRVETFIKVKNVFRSRFFRVMKSWLGRGCWIGYSTETGAGMQGSHAS
jgi:hypothetical protein